MKKVYIVWIIIMLMLVGTLTFIGWYKANTYGVYHELEKNLQSAAESYFGNFPERLPNAGSRSITSEALINGNFLESLETEDDLCIGYVIVTRNTIFYNYRAYIRCGNYTTRGFDDTIIENTSS